MVAGRVAENASPPATPNLDRDVVPSAGTTARAATSTTPHTAHMSGQRQVEKEGGGPAVPDFEEEEPRPAYLNACLAGGIGGLTGDMLMHSLDTVKTRQQGDPYRPPKYHSLGNTYQTILKQEGVMRGLYGGVIPAAVGSFAGTFIFFGAYEWSKRQMIDNGVAPSLAYLTAGIVADLAIGPLYVPTEVLKTRLQLQGRYDNPHFKSGFNYRSTLSAAQTIVRTEGLSTLFFGYRATLCRDVPFSAFQFALYEEARKLAKRYVGSQDIGLPLEILTAASAGGMAGLVTTPLDVVKTRLQTQVNPTLKGAAATQTPAAPSTPPARRRGPLLAHDQPAAHVEQRRGIATSSPSTSIVKPGMVLDTSSVMTGLKMIYRTEGVWGLFRGVGPRAVWTSVQSGTMLVLYQELLKRLEMRNAALGAEDA